MKVIKISISFLLFFGLIFNLIEIGRIAKLTASFKTYVNDEIQNTRQQTINNEMWFKNMLLLTTENKRNRILERLGLTNDIFTDGFQIQKAFLKEKLLKEFLKKPIKLINGEDRPFLIIKELSDLEKALEAYRLRDFCIAHLEGDESFNFKNSLLLKSIPDNLIHYGFDPFIYYRWGFKFEILGVEPTDEQHNYNFRMEDNFHLDLSYAILYLNNDLGIDTISRVKRINIQ